VLKECQSHDEAVEILVEENESKAQWRKVTQGREEELEGRFGLGSAAH